MLAPVAIPVPTRQMPKQLFVRTSKILAVPFAMEVPLVALLLFKLVDASEHRDESEVSGVQIWARSAGLIIEECFQ